MSFLDDFPSYFFGAFKTHKYLLIFVLALCVLSVVLPIITYDYDDIDQIYDDAYLDQESEYSLESCWDTICWNVYLNVDAYCHSIILGYGAIIDIMVNMGVIGRTYAANAYFTDDYLLFFKLTFMHAIPEDISTILNSFASMILAYFVIVFIRDAIKVNANSLSSRLRESWEANRIHLMQSLAVFFVGIVVMVYAGICKEFLTVPIGNFVAGI